MDISKTMYRALEMRYKSEITAARATLMVYFNNPVAIGEHPQHLEEMDKLLDTIACAQDKLDNLVRQFSYICDDTVEYKRASP